MSFNWSDPYQGQGTNTAAQIQSGFRPETVSIAPIVAAIMRQRMEAQQQQRQQTQDLVKGINDLSAGYGKYQAQGSADDAANAAIYGSQYPNDPTGAYTDPGRVPDYGGQDALKTELIKQKLLEAQAKTNETWAKGHDAWTGGSSGYDPSQPETFTDDQGREWRKGSGGQWYPMTSPRGTSDRSQINTYKDQASAAKQDLESQMGVPPAQLPAMLGKLNSYHPGVDAFPALGTQPAIADSSQGQYKDNILAAAQRYKDALSGISQTGTQQPSTQPPVSGPPPVQPSAGPSVVQSDVNQAAQASQGKEFPPAGTERVVNGKAYVSDGTGWLPKF